MKKAREVAVKLSMLRTNYALVPGWRVFYGRVEIAPSTSMNCGQTVDAMIRSSHVNKYTYPEWEQQESLCSITTLVFFQRQPDSSCKFHRVCVEVCRLRA